MEGQELKPGVHLRLWKRVSLMDLQGEQQQIIEKFIYLTQLLKHFPSDIHY